MSDDDEEEKDEMNLRYLYRDTIIGQAYVVALKKFIEEIGGVDKEIEEKLACVFEEVGRLRFRSLLVTYIHTHQQCFADMLNDDVKGKATIEVM